jgi:hypothetical protein
MHRRTDGPTVGPETRPTRVSRARHLRLTGGLVVLALTAALSVPALAAAPYTVALKLPSTVKKGHAIKITAAGLSSNASSLSVFVSLHPCAKTAKAEAGIATAKIISHGVVHHYSKSASPVAGVAGRHYACAYLTAVPPAKLTYARASKAYIVVAPAPPKISLVVTPGTEECSAVSFNVKVSDSSLLRNVNVDLGYGFAYNVTPDTYDYQELYQEGYPGGSSWTATVKATDANGLVTTVSKPFTAPACPSS